MAMGPIQLLVIGFDDPEFRGEVRAELARLRENDIIRLVDLLVVYKHPDGTLERYQQSDLTQEESQEFGALVGALIGLGAGGEEGAEVGAELGAAALEDGHVLSGDDIWYVDEAIPLNTAAAIALIEHRWAIPLRETIFRANGFHLADAWVHPADLVAIGQLASEEAESH